MPRRVRYPTSAGLPHGREAVAVSAMLGLLAQLLFAQLTIALAVAFVVITRLSRWRPRWLIVPAAAGLILTLAAGLDHSVAGYTAGPAHVLGYLGHGHLIKGLGHPFGAFDWAGSWLPA